MMLFCDVKCWDVKYYKLEILILIPIVYMSLISAYTVETRHSANMPYFIKRPNNVTFHRGETAVLVCAIENLGTKTVIWRRASDPNPIIIGDLQFIPDPRMAIQKLPEKKEWNLLIKNVQPEDSGVYECQVSARKKLTRLILLRVNKTKGVSKSGYSKDKPLHTSPTIFVSGTQFVEKGDPVHLVCNASGATQPPDNLDWFKDGIKLSPDAHQKITLNKYKFSATKTLASVLVLKHSQMSDAGTYVCRSSELDTTSVKVHILNAGSPNVKRGTSTAEEMTSGGGGSVNYNVCKLFPVLLTMVYHVIIGNRLLVTSLLLWCSVVYFYQFTGDIS